MKSKPKGPPMDQAQWQAMLDGLSEMARVNLERDGALIPVFIAVMPNGSTQMLPMNFDADVSKGILAEIAGDYARQYAVGSLLIAESWMGLLEKDDPYLQQCQEHGVSSLPDHKKCEVVMVSLYTPEYQGAQVWKFFRVDNGETPRFQWELHSNELHRRGDPEASLQAESRWDPWGGHSQTFSQFVQETLNAQKP